MKILFIDLNHPAQYIHMGILSISLGNLIMILSVIALFVIALFLPFPMHSDDEESHK